MESVAVRLAGAAGALAVLWVGVYWLYPSSGRQYGVVDLGPTPAVLADTLPAAVRSEIRRERQVQPVPPVQPAPVETLPQPKQPEAVVPVPAPVVTKPAVEAPRFETYTVKAGDTLEKIAKARLGSSAYSKAIAQANPLKDPHRLKVGELIKVPLDPSNIQGRVVPEVGKPAGEVGQPAGAGWTEYTVVPGDTLSKISLTVYGSSKHWQLILDANSKTLPGAEKLRVGMKLVLPPKPAA
ncbi:MAG: LysM peptidoglycan-binding domain-containing protein [Planctomycetota bacterium]